ncbi:MAG: rane protein [Pseudoduganella sp.]|jgi:anti-sigma factor RsiW|nr:rane protein [Pseudoduganella sp.]
MNEDELQAWVDRRLPPERQAAVERYLAGHPAEAARLDAYRAQNAALHALFDGVLDAGMPPPLQAAARHAPPRAAANGPAWRTRAAAMLAIAVGAALAGGAAGWTLRGAPAAYAAHAVPTLPRQAALAHTVYSPEVKHPVEVGADQQQHLVAWLSKRLGKQLRPPQLGPQGYELIGGRLLPGEGGPVAQFMYTDAGGQRLTLYVSSGQQGGRDTAFRFAQEGKVGVFYWIDGSFGYALSAAVGRGELSQIAHAVYEQLQP